MSVPLIASLVLLASVVGLAYLVGRRVPELWTFPETEGKDVAQLKREVREWFWRQQAVRSLSSPETLLIKLLSKGRVASLRAETKTSRWMEQLRRRSQERQRQFEEEYWNQFKKGGKKEN